MTLTHSFQLGGERYAGSVHPTVKVCLWGPTGKQKGVMENMEESRLSRGIDVREKGLEENLNLLPRIGKTLGKRLSAEEWERRASSQGEEVDMPCSLRIQI